MAMPSSGCIALRTCIVGINCSSISCAVSGIACSPASLCGLSVQASKTAPHGMTEFYGYVPVIATLSISPQSLDYGPFGGTDTITVTANSGNPWNAISNNVWIDVSSGSGTGNGSFSVTVFGLRSGFRSGSVSVTSNAPTATLNISQSEIEPV